MATKIIGKDGKPRWKARRYIWDPETGSSRERTKTFSLKREADHWEAVEREKYRQNKVKGSEILLEAFVGLRQELWYGLALQTSESYQSHLRRRILPTLGGWRLEDITPTAIENAQAEWALDSGPATIRGTRAALSFIMKNAVKDRRIEMNPVLMAAKPKDQPGNARARTLTDDQIRILASRLEKIRPVFRAYMKVGVSAGLRAGEIAALNVGDIDIGSRRIHVNKSLAGGGRNIVQVTKNGGTRYVPISKQLLTELDRVADLQRRAEEPLFTCDGKRLTHQVFMRTVDWNTIVQEIEPNFRFHDLRATAIVRWLRAGISTAVVRTWAGHADLATTTVYARLAGTDDDHALALLDAADDGAEAGR